MLALEDTGLLTQDSESRGTTIVNARNGFNNLSRLAMLWTVRHHWPVGARFAFKCYRHWAQFLFRHPGDAPFILLIR